MAAPDTPDEDDALHWDGDDEPAPQLPAGWVAKGKGADRVVTEGESAPEIVPAAVHGDDDVRDAAPAPLGNGALVGLGMLGGVYLLYTIGWIIGGFRLLGVAGMMMASDGQGPAMWTAGNTVMTWLAILAPAIWFLTVTVLSKGRPAWVRWVWLIVGAVVLVPWPLLMGGIA